MDKPTQSLLPDGRSLTWAALLGRWVDFARSAVGLPVDDQGQRLRASVPDLIMLQAVWFALRDLGELPADERQLGLDRAEILIERHAAALRERFDGATMPVAMAELIEDARGTLRSARGEGGGDDQPAAAR